MRLEAEEVFRDLFMEMYIMIQILRLPAAMALNGLSRSSTYNHIAQGLWPKPVAIGARAVGFPAAECEAVIAARIAGKSDDEIRALVARLVSARKTVT